MADFDYDIVDVFVGGAGGGNPLAVVLDADSLSPDAMQHIAREFNFSETAFVGHSNHSGADYRVRIFTPTREVPFAGHPNIGTAFVLKTRGLLADAGDARRVVFDEQAGLVPVTFKKESDGRERIELRAPMPLSFGGSVPATEIAAALGLPIASILTATHEPCEASVGLRFMMIELTDLDALARAKANISSLEQLEQRGLAADLFCYVRTAPNEYRARMFAPLDDVPEDPATGSAAAAFAALRASFAPQNDSAGPIVVRQGIEMGRPSLLIARVSTEAAEPGAFIGGYCRQFARGRLTSDGLQVPKDR